MLTCCGRSVLDVFGVIPQAESSTTTLQVGIARTAPSGAQDRTRERIKKLRYILRACGEEKRRMGGNHGLLTLYKTS